MSSKGSEPRTLLGGVYGIHSPRKRLDFDNETDS